MAVIGHHFFAFLIKIWLDKQGSGANTIPLWVLMKCVACRLLAHICWATEKHARM